MSSFPSWEFSFDYVCTRWIKEWKFKAKWRFIAEKIDFPHQLRISELDIWPFSSWLRELQMI